MRDIIGNVHAKDKLDRACCVTFFDKQTHTTLHWYRLVRVLCSLKPPTSRMQFHYSASKSRKMGAITSEQTARRGRHFATCPSRHPHDGTGSVRLTLSTAVVN